jgi:hypothetical protein
MLQIFILNNHVSILKYNIIKRGKKDESLDLLCIEKKREILMSSSLKNIAVHQTKSCALACIRHIMMTRNAN